MLEFRPPKDSPLLIGLTKFFMPLYLKLFLDDTTLEVTPEGLARFKAMKGKRALVCPNHANRHDPMIMFEFCRIVNEEFNYIAAREVFDWHHGLNGWWIQHLGAYSVVRGAVDRESFKTTRSVLAEGKKKLVLFPEGEISRQNDTLMPLESGAAQMSFWALSDIRKNNPSESLYIIPLALKYTYARDITSELRGRLAEMERKLGIPVSEKALNVRIRNVAEKLLTILEREYHQDAKESETMNERVTRLRRLILSKLAQRLNLDLNPNQRELEHVRILRNTIDDIIFSEENAVSEYEKKIHDEKVALIKSGYRDLDRVVRFIAIYDGYVTEHMTQERCADVIDRLESEIFGDSPSSKGPRRVLADVGEPIDLGDYFGAYKTHKKPTVEKITDEIFGQVTYMLNELETARKQVFLESKSILEIGAPPAQQSPGSD